MHSVLVVDDNSAHRYALCRTLEESGFRTIAAATRLNALEHASLHPDIALVDVHLPDIDGFEVCRRLKANRETADIPVVMFSSSSQDSSTINCAMLVGAKTFLFFPIQTEHLIAVVQGAFVHKNS